MYRSATWEVLNLKIKNIEFEQNLFYIDIAKNDNQRIIPISQTLKEEILEYIEKTPFILENHDFLLCIDYENKLKQTNVLNTHIPQVTVKLRNDSFNFLGIYV